MHTDIFYPKQKKWWKTDKDNKAKC